MGHRILLTGATGLIGGPTLETLVGRGHFVVAISRNPDVSGASETLVADLLDPAQRRAAIKTAKATHLLHLAWNKSRGRHWNSAENVDWSAATLQLVREFADAGGKRAVCVGSCAEYDWSSEEFYEDTPLRPTSLYGRAKASTGTLLTVAAGEMQISLAWARLFYCYGRNEPRGRLLGDLLSGLATGQRVACTDGLQIRDFLHTFDVGRALTRLLESDYEGAMNIASGVATPVKDLIDVASRLMGRPDLIDLGALAQPVDSPARLVADISRLRSIGFTPKFSLEAGLKDCVDISRTDGTPADEE